MFKLFVKKFIPLNPVNDHEQSLLLKFKGEGKINFIRLLKKSSHRTAADLITQALNIYAYILENSDIFAWVLAESEEKDIVELIHTALEHYRTFHLDVNAGRRKKFIFTCPEPIVSKIKSPDE